MSTRGMERLVDRHGQRLPALAGFEQEYTVEVQMRAKLFGKPVVDASYVPDGINNNASFQEDGSRLYMDVGCHPEHSTAEDTDFLMLAYRVLHGHKKVAAIYQQAVDTDEKVEKVRLGTNNVDHNDATWGYHISHLALRSVGIHQYTPALIAHHASRIVWSGSGWVREVGFRDTTRPTFVLSGRAHHLHEASGSATTRERPLVNTKDEPLADAGKYRRIHDISAESVFSPFVNALLVASESIVLRAVELGVSFDDLVPEKPVLALRAINTSPDMKTTIKLTNGERLTGVELQLRLAERAIKATWEADYLTEQEIEWAQHWYTVCEDLRRDTWACGDRLDWVVKRKMLERKKPVTAMNRAEFADAIQMAGNRYHQLLPVEGVGMQAIERGHFAFSPTAEQLDGQLPLPRSRGALRARIMAAGRKAGAINIVANWDFVEVQGTSKDFGHKQRTDLKDPLRFHDKKAEAYIRKLLVSGAVA